MGLLVFALGMSALALLGTLSLWVKNAKLETEVKILRERYESTEDILSDPSRYY